MIRCGTILGAVVGGWLLAGGGRCGAETATNAPDFKEVYDLIRGHLPGVTDASLNDAAVVGLLSELKGRAKLVGAGAAPGTNTTSVRAAVVYKTVGWLRVSELGSDLANNLRAASESMTASNKLTGMVVDLRFAYGHAFDAVKDAAAVLLPARTPLVVLVNGETSGAAELLAAELREGGALMLGSPTAGLAMTTTDFPLSNGQRLRLATTPATFHGSELAKVVPDIRIAADPAQEKNWLENPYGPADDSGGSTNGMGAFLDHTSEADLVRQRQKERNGGAAADAGPAAAKADAAAEPPAQVLRDPVLARAVDLVEGLAVVKAGRL